MSAENMNGLHDLPANFEWRQEYDELLEQIASTDMVASEWSQLRDILKYKIQQNIDEYITHPHVSQTPPRTPISNPALSPRTLTSGGLRLPPFPKHEVSEVTRNEFNSHGPPKIVLTEEDARVKKASIFAQLYDFDKAPFTIQRISELALRPRQHYKSIGKYLRALEKSLLVTSTHDAFPIISLANTDASGLPSSVASPSLTSSSSFSSLREASTPLFSPIPFLHGDARRHRSRSLSHSPALSPLSLSPTFSPSTLSTEARRQLSPHASGPTIAAVAVSDPPPLSLGASLALGMGMNMDMNLLGGPAIGMVDELDDPNPSTGHMSDHPTALTAATSSGRGPLHGSLEERFTRATVEEDEVHKGGVEDGRGIGVGKESDVKTEKLQEEEDHEVEDMVIDEPLMSVENEG